VSSRHETEYYKTAQRMRDSVQTSDSFACIGAGTTRVGSSQTRAKLCLSWYCVRSTQHQFRQSVRKRGMFHVIGQALFRQGRDIAVS